VAVETAEGLALAPKAVGGHAERSGRLGLGTLTAYGAGSLVQDVTNFALNNLLLFYLTIVCGLSGSAAGIALGVALVLDSFVDPLVGCRTTAARATAGAIPGCWPAPSHS